MAKTREEENKQLDSVTDFKEERTMDEESAKKASIHSFNF